MKQIKLNENYVENVLKEAIQNGIEEAIQETTTEKMDKIIEIHEQWETVGLLCKLLNRELKLNDGAQPSEVREAMTDLQKRYQGAMLQWRELQGITKK